MLTSTRRRFSAAAIPIMIGAVLGLLLGFVSPAQAVVLPLPSCSTNAPAVVPATGLLASAVNQSGLPPHCWYLPSSSSGEAAGYLGADDSHTRYRFIQTNFPVSAQLPNLNGPGLNGAAGVEECDPNIGYAAQFGVVKDIATGLETPFYAQGFWNSVTGDPCINHQPLVPAPDSLTNCPVNGTGSVLGHSPNVFCGSFAPVSINDQLNDFAIFYTPGGFFFHRTSFGFCDTTQGQCRQAYANSPVSLNYWEVGAGIFSGAQFIGAPPNIPVVAFTRTSMNCYTCAGGAFRPISVIQPVNSTDVGGVENVQDVNSSGQGVLSANNSLDANGDFTMSNGSTS